MTDPIGGANDQALQPAGAAARALDAGIEATRKALDRQALEGRDAVQAVRDTNAADVAPPRDDRRRGRLVDRTA